MSARTMWGLLAFFVLVQAADAAVIQLPRTGQTICWDTAGTVIQCAGTGQDGETLNGVEWPSPRFNDNGNGTLTDRLTGLVWLKEANCFGQVAWQQGLDAANALADGACGLSDGSAAGQWRLPNRKELISITNQNVADGGAWLNSQGFVHGQHTYYWTSDTCLDYDRVYKWIVHPIGAAYPDSWNTPSGSRFVMLVRDPVEVTMTAAIDGGHGMIASANPLTGAYGSAAGFILSPELGYLVSRTVTGTCQPGSFDGNVYNLGRATADCSVSFSFVPITHTISTSTSGNGSITCTPAGAVPYSMDASCTATPATGNNVVAVTVDGVELAVTDPASFTHPFPEMITDHSMFAAFDVKSYKVSFLAGDNGFVDGSTSQTVSHGGNTAAVTAFASTGYHFLNWTGDNGFAATTANPLTLSNVTSDLTVRANFAVNDYLVTPGSAANGSVTPATPQSVSYNGVTRFTLAPDIGYRIASVTGCGGTLAGSTYTTAPVTGNCTMSFSFAPITYTIDVSTSGAGRIQCTPGSTVTYNETVSCTAIPETGNHIADVTVDGVEQMVTDPLSFTRSFPEVTASHTMRSVFSINSYTVGFTVAGNGSLTGSTSQTVSHGGNCTSVTAVPAPGYHFVNWTGDNGFVATSANPVIVSNVVADQAVIASFAVDIHLVTPGTTTNGSIVPARPQTVTYNATSSFAITPDTGYRIASVTGCGGTLSGSTFTTAPVTSDCSVTASFVPITYDISAACADDKGAISCPPAVNYGGAALCTITPHPGFRLAALTDNSTDCLALVANNGYAIANITAAHSLVASFTANSYAIGDVLKTYKAYLGQLNLSDSEKATFDVAPLGADGRPLPDGKVDLGDVVLLLRKTVGAVTW